MTYYFISGSTGGILESNDCMGESGAIEDAQDLANEFGCQVWVIKGEHAGIDVEPQKETTAEERWANEDLRIIQSADLEKLARWNAGEGIPA